jgi:sugar (pentulose or hexulose) kinase
MKAALLDGPGRMTVGEFELAPCGPDDMIVKVHACGICGSDRPFAAPSSTGSALQERTASAMTLIGLDVGTTGCKAMAFSEEGKSLGLSYREYGIDTDSLTFSLNHVGGLMLRWRRDLFGLPEVLEAERRGCDPYDVILSNLPAGPSPAMALPHLNGAGTPSRRLRGAARRPKAHPRTLEGVNEQD